MSFIFVYSRPGKGKSTLASTMTNLGYKVLFIDVDQKIEKMHHLKPLIEAGKIQVRPITAKLTETDLKQRITKPQIAFAKQPKGYIEFCDIISELEQLASNGEKHECDVLVIDSLTSLIEHLDRLISQIQKKDHFTFDEWDILLTNLEEMMYTLLRLQSIFKHVIVTCHIQPVTNESTGVVEAWLPSIKGSMRNKIGKYFDEMYVMDCITGKDGKSTYQVLTKGTGKYEARTSRTLPTWAPADFGVLFKEEKIRSL